MAQSDADAMAHHDFFVAFAAAVLCWQHVEQSLFGTFYKMLDKVDIEAAGAIFYAQNSFGAKLKVVDKVAQTVLDELDLVSWRKIKEELDHRSRDRNALVHLTAVADFQADGTMGLAMAPSMFVPKALRQTRPKIDATECDRLADVFRDLGLRLSAFRAP